MGRIEKEILEKISGAVDSPLLASEPLAAHTTYRVGGSAEYMLNPATSDEAARAYRLAWKEGFPVTLLGGGSNVIAPDAGIEGLTIKLAHGEAPVRYLDRGKVVVDAGAGLVDLARAAASRGLGGLEPVAGIPGTVGGAVIMNAGTKDGEIGSIVRKVEVMTQAGRRRVLSAGEMSFGYRRSVLQGSGWLVLRVELKLRRGDGRVLVREIERVQEERWSKFPLETPNAGSVFKRPPGDFAGRLIEEAGCKGLRIGDAMVSTRHANFILNAGAATSEEIIALIAEVRKRVFDHSGVYLQMEQIPLCPAGG